MKRALVTVGISACRPFGPYLDRWRRTFKEFGGADYRKIWFDRWPPGSPAHGDVHYAFKVHAVWEAHEHGCTSVLWCDSSCWAIRDLAPIWERIERDGHVLVEDANALGAWSSDRSLAQFGISRDDAMGVRLMCGTCWGVDFTNPRSLAFVTRLRELATRENFVGTHQSRLPGILPDPHPRPGTEGAMVSDDPRVAGHRSDEVYMSLLARELGMVTQNCPEFAGGSTVYEHTCIRSGYDLPSVGMEGRLVNGIIDYGVDFNAD